MNITCQYTCHDGNFTEFLCSPFPLKPNVVLVSEFSLFVPLRFMYCNSKALFTRNVCLRMCTKHQ